MFISKIKFKDCMLYSVHKYIHIVIIRVGIEGMHPVPSSPSRIQDKTRLPKVIASSILIYPPLIHAMKNDEHFLFVNCHEIMSS
jgi:hypothetical protein